MAALMGRRPMMTLFTEADCIYSHSCRFVLVEKEVDCQVVDISIEDIGNEVAEINPYNETPTLLDRELVLYGANVINEYLEERLPHPPLMPIDPVSRARARLMVMRFEREWIEPYASSIRMGTPLSADKLRDIRDGLIALSPMLSQQHYILGDDFSLVDCVVAPLLWRLPSLGIKLPSQAKSVSAYAERVFARPSFNTSLTKEESGMVQA